MIVAVLDEKDDEDRHDWDAEAESSKNTDLSACEFVLVQGYDEEDDEDRSD